MSKQIVFILILLLTIGVFSFTLYRLYQFFQFTKSYPISDYRKRFMLMMKVAIAQTKIFRLPIIGFIHAMVFWGFILITIGSLEMVIDGVLGLDRSFDFMGPIYNLVIGAGDFFAWFILFAMLVFLFRRLFLNIKRFKGDEMKAISKLDANLALSIILFLMISLIGLNIFYIALHPYDYSGYFPISSLFAGQFLFNDPASLKFWHEFYWWSHILLIFVFANILPYSKHFHVFLSVPNVFFSRLEELGYMSNMESVTKEVKLMMNPETAFAAPSDSDVAPERFGVKDVEDVSWINYFDALACTECGRCTEVCPANITGKKLSPRKIVVDLRARMKEKGPNLVKHGKSFDDKKALLRDYITEEELWACTTCNACAQECPVNINQPSIILDMRRYLVMEEAKASPELNAMFTNIENNGAPWQYPPQDRMKWADDLFMNQK